MEDKIVEFTSSVVADLVTRLRVLGQESASLLLVAGLLGWPMDLGIEVLALVIGARLLLLPTFDFAGPEVVEVEEQADLRIVK